jgi:hypothetical protein
VIQNNYLNYLLSFLFATFFVYFIPWAELNGQEFPDLKNYIGRIIYLRDGGDEAEFWGVQWIFSEPLWKEIIIFIGYAFEDYRAVIYFLSFLIAFVYVSFLLKRVEPYMAMIFLFNPMIVDMFMGQTRIAIAFSLVLIAYNLFEKNNEKKYFPLILLIMAFLIHMSMIIFYGIYYLLYRLNKKVENKKYYLIAITTALFMAFFMKFGSNILLTIIGDSHADYGEVIESSSLSYSMAWFIIAIIIGTFAEFKDINNRVLVAYAITIMCFFFFSSILGMFAARYVAVIMPIIIISIGYLPKHYKQGTYLFLLAYNIFSFKYWLKLTIL